MNAKLIFDQAGAWFNWKKNPAQNPAENPGGQLDCVAEIAAENLAEFWAGVAAITDLVNFATL